MSPRSEPSRRAPYARRLDAGQRTERRPGDIVSCPYCGARVVVDACGHHLEQRAVIEHHCEPKGLLA